MRSLKKKQPLGPHGATNSRAPVLHFFCGKMAAGKSTLAIEIAQSAGCLLLVEDELLGGLYPGEITDVAQYIHRSRCLKATLQKFIRAVLRQGQSLVLDFPGNTRNQRQWFRALIDSTGASHVLHFLDVSDEVCKRQLKIRSAGLPLDAAFTADFEFDAITVYFEPPSEIEGFNILAH